MLTDKQIDNLRSSIKHRSILDLKVSLDSLNPSDIPEACTRVAYDLFMLSKRDASKFNLDKLRELWEAVGLKPECIHGILAELKKLLDS